ncbi:response regulator transcription factor [Oryzobacter terrae]|uniref:response regulator transcription factor n=1 Tax=Oryzobacter terrae TaxID=1620385 RepID=UPI003671F50D
MGQGDPTLELVTDILGRAARSDGEVARVGSVLDLLCDLVEAEVGLLVQSEATRTTVRVIGRRMPEGSEVEVSRELELLGPGDPLLDPVAAGDLTPRTAERTFGAARWRTSTQRAGCVRLCGVDQVCTLPLVGGPELAVAMFARSGADFGAASLERLAALRPVVADVLALVGLSAVRARTAVPHLTAREREVLVLLARGHTCTHIGRALGASPRTIEVHLGRIYTKLGVRDRLSAVLAGYDLALIPPRAPVPARTP